MFLVYTIIHYTYVLYIIVRSLGESVPDNKLGLLSLPFLFEFKLNNHVNMQLLMADVLTQN